MKHNLKFLAWSYKGKKLEILYYNFCNHSIKYFNYKKAKSNLMPFNFHPIFEVKVIKSCGGLEKISFHPKNKLAIKIINNL